MEISQLRREYLKGGLNREDLPTEPMEQFETWFGQAQNMDMPDPTAMIVATVSPAGQPSQRTVLLKYYDENGLVFFTNYGSRKAKEIQENQKVSVLFVWLELERQVMINGIAEKVSTTESAKYFMSRPKDSQLAAWVSSQSHQLNSRQLLMQKFQEMKTKLGEGKIPLPSFWGGYRVRPEEFQFWQGRKSRLHDRFQYLLQNDGTWTVDRLAP